MVEMEKGVFRMNLATRAGFLVTRYQKIPAKEGIKGNGIAVMRAKWGSEGSGAD